VRTEEPPDPAPGERSHPEIQVIRPEAGPTPPAGPDSDPVFPSVPAARAAPEPQPFSDYPADGAAVPTGVAVPIGRNVFALALLPPNVTKAEFLADAGRAPAAIEEGSAAWLDEPERERVCALAADFVRLHVRRIEHGFAIKTPNRHLDVGTIVVSDRQVPSTHLRHARFRWAITDGSVVELHRARLPVGHLGRGGRITTDLQPPNNVRGDENGLGYFLADVLDMLDLEPPDPIAAIGSIGYNTNNAGALSDIDPYLEAAETDGMHDLVLPRGNGKQSALHHGVRYWSVPDANDAAFAVLASLSGEVVIPDLYRRALTKQAYSWLSLILFLAGVLSYALAGALTFGHLPPKTFSHLRYQPPVPFLGYILLAAALFYLGSFVCTHRYWRIDR
jgi:hypothetical protein